MRKSLGVKALSSTCVTVGAPAFGADGYSLLSRSGDRSYRWLVGGSGSKWLVGGSGGRWLVGRFGRRV